MDKQKLIEIADQLRVKKDKAKEQVATGHIPKNSVNAIIIPPQLFEPSFELQSDKWLFNGFVIKKGKDLVLVDPGVDFYSRFLKCGLSTLDIGAVIVSHEHIDHVASINELVEKLARNTFRKADLFFARNAFENKVSPYHKELIMNSEYLNLILLDEDTYEKPYTVLGERIEFIQLFHTDPRTFGFKTFIGSKKVAYISDTGYAIQVKTNKGSFNAEETQGSVLQIEKKHDYIASFYSDTEIAVVNMNDLSYNRHSKYHLSAWDVLDIFSKSSLQRLVIQHIPVLNIEGEDSNYLYKLFFADQRYTVFLPHYLARTIAL